MKDAFAEALLELRPALRGFAYRLARRVDAADDLTQSTILRALEKRDLFEPGTNLKAWCFTIQRNLFLSQKRRKHREVSDPDGLFALTMAVPGNQESALDLKTVQKRMRLLPLESRRAIDLIAEGYEYDGVAKFLGVPTGTIKSRVSRARTFLENGDAKVLAVPEPPRPARLPGEEMIRALYMAGAPVSRIATELNPPMSRHDVMAVLAVRRIRGRVDSYRGI